MPAKKQTKQTRKQNKKQNKNLVVILVIVIILLVFSLFYLFFQLDNLKREDKEICSREDKDCLQDNCECVERELRACPEGFELDEKTCRRGSDFTNSLLKCSKYACNYTVEVNKILE